MRSQRERNQFGFSKFSIFVCRYAPATQLWRGRLHVMGGSKEDRHEPGTEHWSLAVKDGKALESKWRQELPIPRGGPHRFFSLLFLTQKSNLCKLRQPSEFIHRNHLSLTVNQIICFSL